MSTLYRGGKCIPQEIALLYRYSYGTLSSTGSRFVHAGKAFSRFLQTRPLTGMRRGATSGSCGT